MQRNWLPTLLKIFLRCSGQKILSMEKNSAAGGETQKAQIKILTFCK
jgi:hypothetical protein